MACLLCFNNPFEIWSRMILSKKIDAWFDDLDIFRPNFAMVTLIPKENDARTTRKFRPIILLSCCFKFFTKVLTNRLALIIGRLIYEHQYAFIRGGVYRRESPFNLFCWTEQPRLKNRLWKSVWTFYTMPSPLGVLLVDGLAGLTSWHGMVLLGSNRVGRLRDTLSPMLFNPVSDVFSRMLVKGGHAGLVRIYAPILFLVGSCIYNIVMILL